MNTKQKTIVIQEIPTNGFNNRMTSSIDMRISYILRQLGIGFHMRGYTYIKRGVKLALDDQSNAIMITKYMYPKLAKEFNTTTAAIERSIRTVIQEIDCNDSTKIDFLGCAKSKYTNKEFIMAITELIRLSS